MRAASSCFPATALLLVSSFAASAANTCNSGSGKDASEIVFDAEIAKGADPGDPNENNRHHVLVVQCPVVRWGVVRAMELGTYRDGGRVDDIGLATMGYNQDAGSLKFQLWDAAVREIKEHSYKVQAHIHFAPPQK